MRLCTSYVTWNIAVVAKQLQNRTRGHLHRPKPLRQNYEPRSLSLHPHNVRNFKHNSEMPFTICQLFAVLCLQSSSRVEANVDIAQVPRGHQVQVACCARDLVTTSSTLYWSIYWKRLICSSFHERKSCLYCTHKHQNTIDRVVLETFRIDPR